MELPLKAASPIGSLANRKYQTPATTSDSMEFHYKPRLFAFGFGWFLAGLIVYLVARPGTTSTFFPEAIRMAPSMPHWLHSLLGPAPTFVHVLSFSLMSAALVGRTYMRQLLLCGGWGIIEILFELAQYPSVRDRLLRVNLLSSTPFISSFLARGTFDCADILAAIFGAALAGLFIHSTWSDSR